MAFAAPPAIPGASFDDISNPGSAVDNTGSEAPPTMVPRDRDPVAPATSTPTVVQPAVTTPPVGQQFQQPYQGFQQPYQSFQPNYNMGRVATTGLQPRNLPDSGPEALLGFLPLAGYVYLNRRKKLV